MRAPEAPMGWPRATAPPLTFTFSGSSCSSRVTAMRLHGERFVQFVEIHVVVAIPAGFCEDFLDGVNRSHHHPFGLDAADGLRDDARHGRACRVARRFFRW